MFDQITSFDNLMAAARKAGRNCRKTREISRYYFHMEPEILSLQKQLRQGTYRPGPFRYFTIHDPKTRQIAVAPFADRVVHHAVVAGLEPLFERRFIFDSYASRKGKGTHAAVKRAQTFIRRRPWFLKADVRQFFASMDHGILFRQIQRKVSDPKVLALLERIIRNPELPGQGLPIGNLTSQFFANVYLDPFDHYVKDDLGFKCYLRYMDDSVIMGWSRKQVELRGASAVRYLREKLGLELNLRGTYVGKSQWGLSFLGRRIYPGTIRVRAANRKRCLARMKQRVRMWKSGRLSDRGLAVSLSSSAAHLNSLGAAHGRP